MGGEGRNTGENRSVLGYGEEKLLSFEIEEHYKDILISHQGEGVLLFFQSAPSPNFFFRPR